MAIKTKFLADSAVPDMTINVHSFKGDVTLRGYVKSDFIVGKAVALANEVGGVKSVSSEILVD